MYKLCLLNLVTISWRWQCGSVEVLFQQVRQLLMPVPRPGWLRYWWVYTGDTWHSAFVQGIWAVRHSLSLLILWTFGMTNCISTRHWIAYNEQHNEGCLMVFWWISCIHGTYRIVEIINSIIVIGEFLLLHSPTWH